MKQKVGHGVLRVVVAAGAALAGLVVASCHPALYADPFAGYLLEVSNLAADRVTVRVKMGGHDFLDVRTESSESFSSGVFPLESGESRKFRMQSGRGVVDSQEDGYLVSFFGAVYFYETGESDPYRSYEYKYVVCDGEGSGCWDDLTLIFHERPDGTKEYLFVESPDRPFFLERDEENLDLGRIVITFVPSAEDGSEKSVEPVAAGR